MLRRALLPCLLLLAVGPASSVAGPVAHASRACGLAKNQTGGYLGTTYVTSLSASGTSCAKAKGLVKAFNSCRHKHGAGGKCGKVKGYSCSEKRTKGVGQYVSKTSCRNGGKSVKFTYSQNT